MQLPLDVGPGSFYSKDAEIDYKLVATVRAVNRRRFPKGCILYITRKIKLFPCLNPDRALLPCKAPIDTVTEGRVKFGGKGTLKVAARIHRTSWIAGQVA